MEFSKLTEAMKRVPPTMLLCNWPDCRSGPNGGKSPAERVCPCCRCVGYCCINCMEQDWDRHMKECQRVCPHCDKCTK